MGIDPLLFLKYSKNGTSENKSIFVISSKNIKKAVSRNKIRRRAREILRKNSQYIKKGQDLVFIFGKKAEGASFEALEADIVGALRSQGLIK